MLAKPLYSLLRSGVEFKFGEKEIESFELLKSKIVEKPILAIFDPSVESELHCDASTLGFEAVLLQMKKNLKLHPIFYFSKWTTKTESKYHSFELEMLAIIYALRRFRIYLWGRSFKIVTDCNLLALALKKCKINPKIERWVMELQCYDYITEHREGKRMTHVDALSRVNCICVIEDNSFERNLSLAQSKDETIVKLQKLL